MGTTEPRIIIAAVDGSSASVSALRHAKRFAETRHVRLRAVCVWSNITTYSPYMLDWSPRDDANTQLSEASRQVFGKDLPDWYEQEIIEGATAKILIEKSRTAELLVVGNRGHDGFAGLFLGSVSVQCSAHSHCPVMIIREPNTAEQLPVDAPLVVGDDGSANSHDALEWALDIAATTVSPVEIVRTWTIDRLPEQYEELGFNPTDDEVTARVRHDLTSETEGYVTKQPTVTATREVVMAQPAAELIKRSKHALMLVVGSRGRGGFAGLMLGSVSSECASHSHCPVVVVPNHAKTNPAL